MRRSLRTHRRRRAQRLAAAFSLIEVLIAILILALGLLGLGAVIPVVVREQRVASQATRAVIAANNAKAYLQARPDLNRLVGDAGGSRGGGGGPSMGGSSQVNPMGFGVWLEKLSWSTDGLWVMPADGLWDSSYKAAGDLRPPGSVRTTIPLVDRLWPDPSSGADPLLVWDFVARRVPGATPPHRDEVERTIEIAVFVRRLDPAMRVPPGRTRLQVLTGQGVTSQQMRRAVGVEPSSGPTGDGTGNYSLPTALRVQLNPQRPDRLRIDANGWEGRYAAQPGQKLVDNLGNIYTVTRLIDPGRLEVEITPPVSESQRDQIDRVAFTPQIPAAVEVFRIIIPRGLDLDGDGVIDVSLPAQSPNGAGAGMSPWFGKVGQQP